MVDAYPVLKRDYPLNEKNLDWWVNEKESPYTEVKRFDWYRGYHVGGRSLTWGRQSYRLSDLDFEANAKEGIAVDWPIRYADLAPWYDHVERHAGICRIGRRAAAAARRAVPAGDAAELSPRRLIAGPARQAVRGHAADHPGRVANLTPAARPPRALPVPQRLLARLSLRRLLQHAVVDAAGRRSPRGG